MARRGPAPNVDDRAEGPSPRTPRGSDPKEEGKRGGRPRPPPLEQILTTVTGPGLVRQGSSALLSVCDHLPRSMPLLPFSMLLSALLRESSTL